MTRREIDRRDFLRRGLQLGVVALGAMGGSASPSTTSSAYGRASMNTSNWRRLATSLKGSLVLPTNPSFAQDRLLYNSRFANLVPQAVAFCENARDVASCLAFARSNDLPFAARSGGHSYGGYSSSAGLIIDVSQMNSVSVGTRSGLANVGAGAKLIDVYNVLGQHGRLLPGGSCPTVGIAGLSLGGGVGVFSRKFGLTSDNLRSLQMVTADSSVVIASPHQNHSLFWASRGGGGGNFAIATSFEFRTHPMPPVSLFTLHFPWGAAGAALHAWQRWMVNAPDDLWSNCHLFSVGTAGYEVQVAGVWCGENDALAPLIAELTRNIGTPPTLSFTGGEEYLRAMRIEAGCESLTIAACHLASSGSAGQLSRSAYAAKSSYVDAPMDEVAVQSFVDAVIRLQENAPYLGGGVSFDAYGGVINTVSPDASAFVHRDKLACIQGTYSWSPYSSAQELAAGAAWLSWLGSSVFDQSSGAYQNYIDPTLEHWAQAYYGTNLPQLRAIKKSVDPDDVFSFEQSIR